MADPLSRTRAEPDAPNDLAAKSLVYQRLVFWGVIPLVITVQRVLNIADMSGWLQIAFLMFAFAVTLFGWAILHLMTLASVRFLIPQSWQQNWNSVLPGFVILTVGSLLANVILLATRVPRADVFCEISQLLDTPCYHLMALSWNWESVGHVLRLSVLNTQYWVIANYLVALLFGVRRYGFRITHRSALLKENTTGDRDNELPLVARLPHTLGSNVISLAANQHYVEVHTDKGSALVLYRLSDAINELGNRGTQVHRSYWVAYDAISDVRKDGSAYCVVLDNGSTFPISRSYRHILKSGMLRRMAIA